MKKLFCFILVTLTTNFQVKSQINDSMKDTITNIIKVQENSDSMKTAITNKSQENTDSVKITTINIGTAINTPFSEYAPIISADGAMMIFTSKRPTLKKDSTKNAQGMENIYVSYLNDTTFKWTQAKMLGATINQPGRDNSAIALSNDGQRLLLYKGEPNGNIYSSALKGEEWSEPVKLPKPINSDYHESSASIAPDGQTIYFVSDRKQGQGGLDIWVCRKDKNGNWTEAENLGATINTSKDEEGAFIHSDGKTLYFSSKGHNTKGGYDILKSVYENGKWNTPVNMGDAINTSDDDLFFVLTADSKKGYYSSIRGEGMGRKDIYEVTFTYSSTKKNESRLTLFKGVVIDHDTFEPIGADMEIIDNDKNEIITTIKSNSLSGKFLVSLPAGKNYGIAVKREGYLFYSENFNMPDTTAYNVIDKNIPLQKLYVGNKITLKNIFYDNGKATLRNESVSEFDQLINLMKLNPTIKIEIDSYTDSEGTDEFNLTLSQARAQAVLDFLFSNGISKERMVAKGFGESYPLSSNDTEEGKQLNRRTEFKIVNK